MRLTTDRHEANSVKTNAPSNHEHSAAPALLLSIRETAQLLGRPERVLYRWASEGRLPGLRRIGRALYVARPELLEWLGTADGSGELPRLHLDKPDKATREDVFKR